MGFLVEVRPWNSAWLSRRRVNRVDLPRVLFARFRLSVQLLAQVFPPPRKVVKVQRCARVAHWAGWISLFVACNVLGFEEAVAMEAEDIIAQLPGVGW
jgi:hypothetical protein